MNTIQRMILKKLLLALLLLGTQAQAETRYTYYHNDLFGSPVAMTDQAGNVIAIKDYTPYGESSGNDGANHIGFTGHAEDQLTHLTYMQQRLQDPRTGRFLSIDPASVDPEDPMTFNRYAYANNNPYKFVDPDGQAVETVWDAANVAMGAASLSKNVASGNYISAAVDAAGVAVDVAAMAVPGVPGGAGSMIKGVREADSVVNAVKAVPKSGSAEASGAGKLFPKSVKENARQESGNTCVFCGTKTTREPGSTRSEIDHAIPKSRGGDNSLKNAQNTCRDCNRSKGSKTTKEFSQ